MCLAQGETPPLTISSSLAPQECPRDQPSGDASTTALSSTGPLVHLPGFAQEGPSAQPTDPSSCFLPATALPDWPSLRAVVSPQVGQ